MLGSSLSCLVPLAVFSPITTLLIVLPYPPIGFSVSTGVSSVTSPSYTSFVSRMRSPIERRKFSISTSVFLISLLNTSEPTIGQNGTLLPSSWAIARAMAVLPVPGGPASSSARPDIFFDLIRSTTTPAASRASFCPTSPASIWNHSPFSSSPSPFTWLWAAMRWVFTNGATAKH
uniref:Uncharacterized protein n=1 Tax=Anopheles coluzzii TaxID=1518534 RepID=A0A8W7PQA4_ANOCL